MNKFFRKYLPFTKGTIAVNLQYRVRFIFWVMFDFLYLSITFFLWQAIYKNTDGGIQNAVIQNYTFGSMVFYIFAVKIVGDITALQPHNYISDDIRDGSVSMRLIKPLSYRTQLFFQGLGDVVCAIVFFGLPFFVILLLFGTQIDMGFAITPVEGVCFALSCILSLVLNYLISFSFGMIVFFTINSFGIWQLKQAIERMFSGALIPLAFFPGWLRIVANFLPFGQTQYVPVTILMNSMTGMYESNVDIFISLGIQLAWIAGFAILTSLLWRKAVKRMVVLGG